MKDSIIGFRSNKSSLDWKYDKDLDLWCVFYGWTNKKRQIKAFKNTRDKEMFHYSTITDEGESQYIIDRYMDLRISEYDLKISTDKTYRVFMTWFEYVTITDNEFVLDEILFKDVKYTLDPLIFNNITLSLLEEIGYSYIFYMYMIENLPIIGPAIINPDIAEDDEMKEVFDISTRCDAFWEIISFISNETHYLDERYIETRIAKLNELHCFIKIFGELLKN